MVVHETDHAQVEWFNSDQVLVLHSKGFVVGYEMRNVYNTIFTLMREKGSTNLISDNRELKPFNQSDVDWLNNEWFPRMFTTRWKYWAIVEPVSMMGTLSMSTTMQTFKERGLTLRIFETLDEVREWINQVERENI